MRRRISAATLVVLTAMLAACSDNSLPTSPPISGAALKLTINADGCVDRNLVLATINPQIQGLINNLFADQNQRGSTASMWENIKKDKLDGKPIQNHIDNLTKWTLEHLSANTLSDPDGAGLLNATTGSVKLLDLVFRCAGETPTQVPDAPAGFDAIFKLVSAAATNDQQFNTSFNDAAAFIPTGALTDNTLLVIVRQPDAVNVNTPFPKLSRTVDVALAGGKVVTGKHLSLLFCPFETVDHTRNQRLVVAHQFKAVAPDAPVGEGVEYLAPPEGGHIDCPHGIAFNPAQEKNALRRGAFLLASLAGKAWSLVGPKTLYAGHAGIGGLIEFVDEERGLSPMVLVDPYVETGITDVAIPATTYGETINFTAQLRVTNVPAACGLATSPAVCSWVGQPVTQALPGIPTLTLSALTVAATLDGQTQNNAIDAAGVATFSFTHINAGDNQTATLAFAHTVNHPANAPDFAASNATALYTVNRRPLTATATANEWEYGTPEPVTGTFTTSAVQYGESVTPTFTTTQNALTEVGEYENALVADVVFGTGVRAENYIVTKTNATLTVVKAPLAVTANDKSREYGLANPTFTATVVGIKNGDAYTLGFTTPAVIGSDISPPTYPITPSITGARLVRNYDITLTNGAQTITPAPLPVTIGSASRQYGDANPPFSATFTPRNGDILTVAYSTAATTTSPVNAYSITGTVNGAKVGNYAVVVTPGTLTVTTRDISITADNASRNENTANPSFTGTIGGGGLVSGDGVTVSYISPATTESAPGSYPINGVLNSAAAANYNATINPGTLTVISTSPPVLDVDNDFATVGTTVGCNATGSLFQSFTPSTSSLKAVELRFRAGGSFPTGPAGLTTTIRIREGSPTGNVVATATATLTGLTVSQSALANFTFATPLSVNAGGTYVIEWVTTTDDILSLAMTDGDTYAGGTAFGCSPGATANPAQDYYFRTYR